jgi:plastocyanin
MRCVSRRVNRLRVRVRSGGGRGWKPLHGLGSGAARALARLTAAWVDPIHLRRIEHEWIPYRARRPSSPSWRPRRFPSRRAAAAGAARDEPPAAQCGGAWRQPADVIITIIADNGNMSFSPNPATVTRGQTVAWRNSAGAAHTATQNACGLRHRQHRRRVQSAAIHHGTAGTSPTTAPSIPSMVGTLTVQ